MKLVFSDAELVPGSTAWAMRRWEVEPDLSSAVTSVRMFGEPRPVDDPEILEFDGSIVEDAEAEDDDEVEPFFIAVDQDGLQREFDIRNLDTKQFTVGRRVLVRFVETGRLPRGDQIIRVVQIWLD